MSQQVLAVRGREGDTHRSIRVATGSGIWKCSGNVLEMFWKCSGNVLEFTWFLSGSGSNMFFWVWFLNGS